MAGGTPPGAHIAADESTLDDSRRTALVLAVAAAAILLRSLIYLLYEQLAFDSDQAINGLMAKHLAEGRAFPLFFYGQTYMLGVESWVAAPFVLLFGASVRTLRLAMIGWNMAFAVLAIVAFRRDNRLSPWQALAATAFFVMAPASVVWQLLQAQGGIAEPFVYIVVLWLLRRRPLWFGAVLALGFRNREFVAYAVPALLAIEWLAGELDRRRIGDWMAAAVSFAIVWQSVEALKPFADLKGPGTRGELLGGFSGSQIGNLVDRFDFGSAALPERVARLVPEIFRWLSGAIQVDSGLPVPARPLIAAFSVVVVGAAVARLFFLLVRDEGDSPSWVKQIRDRIRAANFSLYLAAVGTIATVAFVAGKPILPGYSRYVILALLLPMGLVGALLALERDARIGRALTILVAIWALASLRDHAGATLAYIRQPPPSPMRMVADQLTAEGITTATAGYWRAYAITFLSRERLRVASSDFVRIQEYQDRFDAKLSEAVAISDEPCPGGRQIGELYICSP